MNLLRVLLRSVCGSHPSDVPPKSKISVQIEKSGNGRRSGAFLHISFKNSSIYKAFGVRQRPPQGAEFVCVPCGANNSKSTASDGVPVRVRPPAPQLKSSQTLDMTGFAGFSLCSALLMYCPSHISRFAVYRLILGGTLEGHRALSGGIYTQNCVGRRNL